MVEIGRNRDLHWMIEDAENAHWICDTLNTIAVREAEIASPHDQPTSSNENVIDNRFIFESPEYTCSKYARAMIGTTDVPVFPPKFRYRWLLFEALPFALILLGLISAYNYAHPSEDLHTSTATSYQHYNSRRDMHDSIFSNKKEADMHNSLCDEKAKSEENIAGKIDDRNVAEQSAHKTSCDEEDQNVVGKSERETSCDEKEDRSLGEQSECGRSRDEEDQNVFGKSDRETSYQHNMTVNGVNKTAKHGDTISMYGCNLSSPPFRHGHYTETAADTVLENPGTYTIKEEESHKAEVTSLGVATTIAVFGAEACHLLHV